MANSNALYVFHPSPNLVGAIDALLAEYLPGIKYENIIVPDLLNRAIRDGITKEISDEVRGVILSIPAAPAPLIFCTCSTLGGVSERFGIELGKKVIRIDRPMAEEAIQIGGSIAIAAALESTILPTKDLLEQVAAEQGKSLEITQILCTEAWPYKQRGDNDSYISTIVQCIQSSAGKPDVIVLAQGSMAPAKPYLVHLGIPVLSSPETAVERVRSLLDEPSVQFVTT